MSVRDIVQAAAGAGGGDKLYVEDVFSTYLYTGTGVSSQTINNGIDLAGKGGLIWQKLRNYTIGSELCDTARGVNKLLSTNTTGSQNDINSSYTSFTSTGFTIGLGGNSGFSGASNVFWTFRKAPKFFDVVTYTGNDVAGRQIAHNLGSVPGMIIVKAINAPSAWVVYHRSVGNTKFLYLNSTAGEQTAANLWNNTTPSSTTFTVSAESLVNASGTNYVAYLFAHNAGGFGEAGDQSVVSCGSYTGNGSATGPVVTLGWEPQYLMIKNASGTGNWQIIDNMRGMPVGSEDATLQANLANAESAVDYVSPTSTGFQITSTSAEVNTNASTYIYLAIRRGPMKKPTSGTEVFAPLLRTGTGSSVSTTGVGFPPDLFIPSNRNKSNLAPETIDRLRGVPWLATSFTNAESTNAIWTVTSFGMDGINGLGTSINASGDTYVDYYLRRAPSFFDVVCYTGPGGTSASIPHSLGVAPELMIVKRRNAVAGWVVYHKDASAASFLELNNTNPADPGANPWSNTSPTASVFTVGNMSQVNTVGATYVAYLFATLPGVSKVGSYTGTGTTQQINCGFTTGARFILIKRTDSTGDWYVWDTARGIVAANDPRLSLNTTAAEVTTDDSIDPDSSGFIVNQVAATNINVSGASYIFLAVS